MRRPAGGVARRTGRGSYSFAVALVLTAVFTTGVLHVEGDERRPASAASRALGYAAFALCGALVLFGLYVMFTSK
jgi:hypothetical protein